MSSLGGGGDLEKSGNMEAHGMTQHKPALLARKLRISLQIFGLNWGGGG